MNANVKKPIVRRWWFWLIIALVVIGGLSTCIGGGGDQAAAPATTAPPSSTAAETEPADSCSPVSDDMARSVLDGSKQGTLDLVRAAAVQGGSGDWFIAIRFKHSAGEDVGVWQSKSLDVGQAAVGSVDGFAKQFTNWPDTGNAGSKAERDAKACLR